MASILIRRLGTLIDIGSGDSTALPADLLRGLQGLLSYQHRIMLRGHERYSVDGSVRNVDIETRSLCRLEGCRLVTGVGFLSKVVCWLQQRGCEVWFNDLSPEKPEGVYTPDFANLQSIMSLRPGQRECLDALANSQCGIVDATMGFGKTALFEMLAHLYPRAVFDILVQGKDIAHTILRRLTRTVPNVGLVGGGKRDFGERVTVCIAASARHMTDRRKTDFLLGDEAHQLVVPSTGSWITTNWRYSRNFGFTGTYGKRGDRADAQLELLFGPAIYTLTYPQALKLGLVVPIHVRWLPIRLATNPASGRDDVGRKRWGIWRNDGRNQAIAADIRQHYPDNSQQILVLVATLEHAVMLWQYLPEFSLCYGGITRDKVDKYVRSGLLPAGFVATTPEIRNQLRQQFETGELRRVIATDVWATGVDFPQLPVLYRADGRGSEIMDAQGPGRVSRTAEGKVAGKVIDCCDFFDPGFFRMSKSRRRSYTKMGWSQEWPSEGE